MASSRSGDMSDLQHTSLRDLMPSLQRYRGRNDLSRVLTQSRCGVIPTGNVPNPHRRRRGPLRAMSVNLVREGDVADADSGDTREEAATPKEQPITTPDSNPQANPIPSDNEDDSARREQSPTQARPRVIMVRESQALQVNIQEEMKVTYARIDGSDDDDTEDEDEEEDERHRASTSTAAPRSRGNTRYIGLANVAVFDMDLIGDGSSSNPFFENLTYDAEENTPPVAPPPPSTGIRLLLAIRNKDLRPVLDELAMEIEELEIEEDESDCSISNSVELDFDDESSASEYSPRPREKIGVRVKRAARRVGNQVQRFGRFLRKKLSVKGVVLCGGGGVVCGGGGVG